MAAHNLLRSLIIVILSCLGKTEYSRYRQTNITAATIYSPHFPDRYPPDTRDKLLVYVDHVRIFRIFIVYIDIDANWKHCPDYLKIWKSSEVTTEDTLLIGPICGIHDTYEYFNPDDGCTVATDRASVMCRFLSTGFTMYFYTDQNIQFNGFMMTYSSRRATPSAICKAMQMRTYGYRIATHVKISTSFLYNKTVNLANMNCEWFIPYMQSDNLRFVSIMVHYLSLGSCMNSKVQIWAMDNSTKAEKALQTLCGAHDPFTISLYDVPHGLRVTFVTNDRVSCGGFHLSMMIITRQDSYVTLIQQITITNSAMENISVHNIYKQFPLCPNYYNNESYCHYVVEFVTEYGYQIHITMSPDLLGNVTAFDGPSVDYTPLTYGEPNFHKEMFGWRSNKSEVGFLSVGPYLTILLNVGTMNPSSLLHYHRRSAFSPLNYRLLNCTISGRQTAILGIFNLNARMNVKITHPKEGKANNYVCYIIISVAKHLVVSLKIRHIEYDQIGENCHRHGIVMYDGSVNSHNKLGPYCELEKGYMEALFDPLVTASNRVYLMMYMYAKEGDEPQSISVDITATRCTGVHVIPPVFRESGVLDKYNVRNETLVKNITYTTQTRCMTVLFHWDIDNAFYLYDINELDQPKLSIHEYVWISCFNIREKWLQMNRSEMSKNTSFLARINKTTTIFSNESYRDIRFVKVYMGDIEERTPQLIDTCSYNNEQNITSILYSNVKRVRQGFIDFPYKQRETSCYVTLSTGSSRTSISAHYFEVYIHRYYGCKLTITEYIHTKSYFSHKTLYENRGEPFLLAHQYFSSVSTEMVILDLSKAIVTIEYQDMAYQYVPVRIHDSVQMNKQYYKFVMHPKTNITAETAQDKCASGGGNLISVSTLEELEAIKSAIANVWMGHIQQGENFQVDILIGLRNTIQLDGTTQWRWRDGTPLTITDWYYPDMISHGIPQQFQNEGDTFMVQPENNAWHKCGMMQIYSPQQSTNWRTIDCNEEAPTTAANLFYICEYRHLTTVGTVTNITHALQKDFNKTMLNSSKSDINCHNNNGDCENVSIDPNNATDKNLYYKYEQIITDYTCPTDWTYIQGQCWLLVNSHLELLSHDNMTIHYCDKHYGQLASVENTDIVRRYLTYVQHRASYGSIWVMSQENPSCVQYRARHDLMETDGERLEIVEASQCVISTQFEYDGPAQHEYKQFINQYYPVHCQNGTNHYRTNTYSMLEVNVTCSPNHVFCVQDVVPVSKTCDFGYLRCGDNSCVSADLVCDGVDDCKTGEDEQDCELPDYWYSCTTQNITISKYCDFFSDCSDGSDEEGCVYPPCSHGQFRCDSGQCVDEMRRCNGRHDGCIDNSDELQCESRENCTNGFYCGECIPKVQENDGRIDCQSKRDEPYISRYYKFGNLTNYIKCSPVEGRCTETNVGCFNRGEACVLGYDTDGRMRSCSNGAHLYNCSSFECPGRYKCPESYCIDMKRVCNGIQDCQHNEDEAECDDTRSPGLYRCGGDQTYSIDRSQVCDGQFDCARPHSDEKYCSLPECPRGCTCRGFYYNCEGKVTYDVSITDANFSVYARTINLANNDLGTTNMFVFTRYSFLAVLRLSRNKIGHVDNGTFAGLYNLITLDLSHNLLTILGQNTFKHLSRLEHLFVHGNLIRTIRSETFNGLTSVVMLNLSSLRISEVKTGALNGLINLKILDLSANGIRLIERGVFDSGQQLTRVILTGNKMADVPSYVFGEITADFIETDAFRFCCFTNKSILIDCSPEFGTYSSCDDLMSNRFLQIIIWVIGCLAVIGNVAVIICRPIIGIKTASQVCIFALSCSDFLTGVYLMILASVDTYYRGGTDGYIIHDVEWRESALCELCGVLSTLSAQLSSFLLLLITLDRFIHLVFPMKGVSYSRKFAIVVCMVVFIVSLIESVIPIGIESYFGENFYSKTALCLAYDFNDISDGWEYTLVVFILVNLLNCIVTLICYIIIYCSIHRSSQKADPRRKADVALAKTLFLLVLTDIACWFPLIITSLAVYAGHKVPRDMAAILAVIVLPINAAINPYLYTISTIQNARSRRQTSRQTKQTDSQISQSKITAHSRQTQPQSSQMAEQTSKMAAQPSQMAAQPGQMAAQPGQMAAQPGQMATQPGQMARQPGQMARQPGQMAAQPGQMAAQPGQMATQPGQMARQPGQMATQPTEMVEHGSQKVAESSEKAALSSPTAAHNTQTPKHDSSFRQLVLQIRDLEVQNRLNEQTTNHLEAQGSQITIEKSEQEEENMDKKEQNYVLKEHFRESTEHSGYVEEETIQAKANGTSTGLEAENRHLNEQNRHLNEQINHLNEKITHLTKQLRESNELLEDQTRQLETEMSWMMTQIGELGAQNRHLNEQIMEVTEQNRHLNEQVMELTEQNRHLNEQVMESTEQNTQL